MSVIPKAQHEVIKCLFKFGLLSQKSFYLLTGSSSRTTSTLVSDTFSWSLTMGNKSNLNMPHWLALTRLKTTTAGWAWCQSIDLPPSISRHLNSKRTHSSPQYRFPHNIFNLRLVQGHDHQTRTHSWPLNLSNLHQTLKRIPLMALTRAIEQIRKWHRCICILSVHLLTYNKWSTQEV